MRGLGRGDFCCDEIYFHLNGPDGDGCEIHFRYFPDTRDYAIPYKARRGGGYQRIHYCPWCGSKLPKELGNELSHIVFDELNLDSYDDPRLPTEFRTDEWWKKRGL